MSEKCGVYGCDNEALEDSDLCKDHDDYQNCEFCGYVSCDSLCRHLFWSDRLGWYSGCGTYFEERDGEKDMRQCVWDVLTTVGEQYAVKLRNAILGRHYLSYFEGMLLGSNWLNFHLGGRWSDGKGGMECRRQGAPPDVDDPKTGCFLVPFPVPGGLDPGDVDNDFGKLLTALAEEMKHRDDDYDIYPWMDGVMWLCALDPASDCQEAEAMTVGWIESWLADLLGFQEEKGIKHGE